MLPSLTLARGQGKLPGFSGGRQHNLSPWGTNSQCCKGFCCSFAFGRYHNKAVFALDAYCLYTKDCIAVPLVSAALRWIVAHPQCFCRYRGMYLSGETKTSASLGYSYCLYAKHGLDKIGCFANPKVSTINWSCYRAEMHIL